MCIFKVLGEEEIIQCEPLRVYLAGHKMLMKYLFQEFFVSISANNITDTIETDRHEAAQESDTIR